MMFFTVMMKLDKRGLADEFGDIVMDFHGDNSPLFVSHAFGIGF